MSNDFTPDIIMFVLVESSVVSFTLDIFIYLGLFCFLRMRAYHAKFCHLSSLASLSEVTDCFKTQEFKDVWPLALGILGIHPTDSNILNPFLNRSVTFSSGCSDM